ncbi:hypothetical protein NADFUDRAFT_84333 [Nadsonia fulvescens var. elongata DSM 6958]|uniref:DASH complex subunit DAM1 n=1 Tax=Nadsonia fulvescens var. elongata DSM 6958 TaxID=857566 RepID=A0A1E3PED2_9ASCO|nr:hypothetical protein NADFUDRAFT_84333 [Nadsonia fulvescens var. elongata DSM 6958]
MLNQNIPSLSQRPTTPHRRSLTYSIAQAHTPTPHFPISGLSLPTPLETILLRPPIKTVRSNDSVEPNLLPPPQAPLTELMDGLADLDQNLQHIQSVHDCVNSFTESFSSLIYGLEMNAWCFEFKEAPTKLHLKRYQNIPLPTSLHTTSNNRISSYFRNHNETNRPSYTAMNRRSSVISHPTATASADGDDFDPNATYMTDEISFVERPIESKPISSMLQSKVQSRLQNRSQGTTRTQPHRAVKLTNGMSSLSSTAPTAPTAPTARRPGQRGARGGMATRAAGAQSNNLDSGDSNSRSGMSSRMPTTRKTETTTGSRQHHRVTKPTRGRPGSVWR